MHPGAYVPRFDPCRAAFSAAGAAGVLTVKSPSARWDGLPVRRLLSLCAQDFPGGQPPILRDLLCALKQFLGCPSLFIVVESPEKVLLMRKAWDMGKDPLTIMRSSPHAVSGRARPGLQALHKMRLLWPDICSWRLLVPFLCTGEAWLECRHCADTCWCLLQLASALKLWLACLPEPLLARELAQVLLQAQACLSGLERLRVLQQILLHVCSAAPALLHPLLLPQADSQRCQIFASCTHIALRLPALLRLEAAKACRLFDASEADHTHWTGIVPDHCLALCPGRRTARACR